MSCYHSSWRCATLQCRRSASHFTATCHRHTTDQENLPQPRWMQELQAGFKSDVYVEGCWEIGIISARWLPTVKWLDAKVAICIPPSPLYRNGSASCYLRHPRWHGEGEDHLTWSPRSERGFWYRRPLHPSEPLGGDIRHRWRCIGMDTIVPDWSNPTGLLSGLVVKDRETRIRRSSGLGAWPSPVPPLHLGSIPAHLEPWTRRSFVYADDTQVHLSVPESDIATAVQRFTECVESIEDWMSANRLKMNADKTQVIWMGSGQRLGRIDISEITIRSSRISLSKTVSDLGVLIDGQLTMADHITSLCRSCFFQLRQILTIKRSLTMDAKKSLVNAFVCSRLDYCNSLWYGISDGQLRRLQPGSERCC